MADIHIQKSGRDVHIVVPMTDAGRKWVFANMQIPTGLMGERQVPISSEFVEDLAEYMRKDDLIVDID